VVGNRIVRHDVADSHRAIVMYRGEYRLRYTVSGQEYYVWANSGWTDVDKQLIQDKVASLPDKCDFRVRTTHGTHPKQLRSASEPLSRRQHLVT
jgi:hypothetical protein